MIFLKKSSIKKDIFVLFTIFSFYLNLCDTIVGTPSNKEVKGGKLFFEEELSIEKGLYNPKDIGVDSDENIYILDGGDQKIKKYDSKGNLLKVCGGKGEGPGETVRAFKISIDEDDRVYILDFQTRKINIFDSELKFIKSIRTGVFFPGCFAVSKGKIYVSGPKTLIATNEPRNMIHIFDIDGRNIGSFSPQHKYQGESKFIQLPSQYASPSVFLIDDDKLYAGYSYYYEIMIFKINKSMNLLRVIKRENYFRDFLKTVDGYKVLMPGGQSLKIFPISDGKLMHVYLIHTEQRSKIYIDILKETGELLSSRISFRPEDANPCFFDGKQNKIYFIQYEPNPRIVRAYLKFTMQ